MTTDLQISTNAFPSITADDVQIAIYDQSDSGAIVTSQQFHPPHNQRAWNFPGLPIANYLFRIFQMVGTSGTVRQQMGGDTFVVPNQPSTVTYFPPEQIVADNTLGFSSGVNSVVFDGTGGKEDWRGRDIGTLVRMGGEGVMKKGVEYSWNTNTGTLQLLNTDDVFNPAEWFNVSFVLQVGAAPASIPTILPPFLTPTVITADYNVNAGTDFGGVLIIRPASVYLEITMPAIATVPVNKRIKFEFDPTPFSGGNPVQQCAKIIFQAGEVLTWLGGVKPALFIINLESIFLYPFIDTDAVKRWRVDSPFGNWLRVGDQVVDDALSANVFNKVPLDGASLDNKQYARLYNEYVLSLTGQVCNYDDWPTGNNKYLFSIANSSNPANAGKFRIPDRRNIFERNTDGARLPGNFQAAQVPSHNHNNGVADDSPPHADHLSIYGTVTTDVSGSGANQPDIASGTPATRQGITSTTGGADGRPANIAVRKYLIV